MKIHLVRAQLFHVDRHDKAKQSLFPILQTCLKLLIILLYLQQTEWMEILV